MVPNTIGREWRRFSLMTGLVATSWVFKSAAARRTKAKALHQA
jgi:hypothetical protein